MVTLQPINRTIHGSELLRLKFLQLLAILVGLLALVPAE